MSTLQTEFGYLNTNPYLVSGNYLGGAGIYVDGAQFKAVVTKQFQNGAQLSATINGAITRNAAQFRGIITPPSARYGAQISAFNLTTTNTGMQVSNTVPSGASFGFQLVASRIVSVPCGNGLYLSGAYLNSGPYLVPTDCYFYPAQIVAQNVIVQNTGAQFRGINTPPVDTRGAQIRGIINSNYNYGSQIKVFNTKSVNTGVQFKGIINQTISYPVQFKGVINKVTQYGMQVTSERVERYGMQFRAVLYNLTQLRLLADFASRGTSGTSWTVLSGGTASSSSNGFQVNNLNTDIVEQVYRSTSKIVQLRCDTGITQGVFMDTFAMLNHNLTTSAAVSLDASNDPLFTTADTIQISVTRTNAYWLSEDLPQKSYRYFRLNINDNSNIDGYVQIGTIVFGASEIFSVQENFVDRVVFGQKQFVNKVFTEGHTNVSNDRGKKKYLTLEFRNLVYNRTNYRLLSALFETYGTTHKVLWIPEPKEPQRFAVFGKLQELPQEEHNYKGVDADYVGFNVTVDESL